MSARKPRPEQAPASPRKGKAGGVVSDEERQRLIAAFLAKGGRIKRIVGATHVPELDRCTPHEAHNMEPAPR